MSVCTFHEDNILEGRGFFAKIKTPRACSNKVRFDVCSFEHTNHHPVSSFAMSMSVQQQQQQQQPLKLAIFGTHPQQFNGYAKVVYELIQEMSKMQSQVRVYVFGFQNIANEQTRGAIPDNVTIYDAFADETPKKQGFGIELVKNYLALCDPDVVIIYNDLSILTSVLNEMKDVPNRRFKIIAYIDQVYLCQKKAHIDFVNAHADYALLFSPNWQRCIQDQGLTLPCDSIPHGVNRSIYYAIPPKIVRKYYGFAENDFIILNMNRNQPRKRWDLCLMAFAEVLYRLPKDRAAAVKMVIATAPRGAWNLPEIFGKELRKHGIPLEEGLRHIIFVDAPQRMSDREVNLLYNLSDIGINTCDGEGFGLCNIEQAAVGKPQVVTKLGAFVDAFDDTCAMLIEPKCSFYLDSTRDSIGGEALMCSHLDFADAILRYYNDAPLRERHGQIARQRVLERYKWDDIAAKVVTIARDLYGCPPLKEKEEDEEYDVEDVISLIGDSPTPSSIRTETEAVENKDAPQSSGGSTTGVSDDIETSNADFSFDITKKQEDRAIGRTVESAVEKEQNDDNSKTKKGNKSKRGNGGGGDRDRDRSMRLMREQLRAMQAMMDSMSNEKNNRNDDNDSDSSDASSGDEN